MAKNAAGSVAAEPSPPATPDPTARDRVCGNCRGVPLCFLFPFSSALTTCRCGFYARDRTRGAGNRTRSATRAARRGRATLCAAPTTTGAAAAAAVRPGRRRRRPPKRSRSASATGPNTSARRARSTTTTASRRCRSGRSRATGSTGRRTATGGGPSDSL